ncbi:DUF3307 domain-containing protein [Kribbella sp. CA-294648]|uniref:DUF3307 domain-containing protein n=1 Tax=Kribbella sp. CA-294648 TaxID=3239948 RepID=UPI003D8FE7A0
MDTTAGVTFAAVFAALWVAHNLGDQWIQTHHQAMHKGKRSRVGSLACLRHVVSYTVTTVAFTALVWVLPLGLEISAGGFVAGQIVSAVTHYWADRRFTLASLIRIAGKREYAALGVPRERHNDNPCVGTGAFHLDQSFHVLCLFVAALLTALI